MCGMTDQTAPPSAPLSALPHPSAPLRLDARRPLLWRDPATLQIGADPAVAVLERIDDDELRLIESLAVGVTVERLHGLAAHLGVRRERVDALLALLSAALEPEPVRPSSDETLVVVGHGLGAERVAAVLAEGGHPVTIAAPAAAIASRARTAVLVSPHVIDPLEHARWLRRDRPHLAVVFGEEAVTIGPLVQPGTSACLSCVERHRADDDPARTVIATQLWGRAAAAETPTAALAAGLATLRMLRTGLTGTSLRIDARTGATATTTWTAQPDCGCQGLTLRAVPAARRGSGSEPAPAASVPRARPTTARASAAPA